MKILHLPLNVPGSEQVGQERGFREVFGDENYTKFDYLNFTGNYGNNYVNELLIQYILNAKPDIIWAQLQETNVIRPETWKEIRERFPEIWLTTWSGDARTYVPPGLASILPYFDIFYNATDQEALYKPYCKRYEFMPIAVDPEEVTTFKEINAVPDVIFIGNHYGMDAFPDSRARYELMVTLTKEFGNRFGVYGSGWPTGDINILGPVALKDQGSYYHAAKVVVSIDHFSDMCYWSERRLWALASGTPVVIHKHKDIHNYFVNNVQCLYFDSPEECINQINRLLSNDAYIQMDTYQALTNILNKHTWKQRAEQVRRDYEDQKR